jgi:hypothetical protein
MTTAEPLMQNGMTAYYHCAAAGSAAVAEEGMIMLTRSNDLRRTGRPDIVRRGEDNVAAKLTEAQVLEMRALAATGVYTKTELAQRYPVTQTSVMYAVTGHTWGHLPGALSPPWRRYSPPKPQPQRRGVGRRQRQILLMALDRAQDGRVLRMQDIFKELYGWTVTPGPWSAKFNPVEIGLAAYRTASGHVSRSITALSQRGLIERGERIGHLRLTEEGTRRAQEVAAKHQAAGVRGTPASEQGTLMPPTGTD